MRRYVGYRKEENGRANSVGLLLFVVCCVDCCSKKQVLKTRIELSYVMVYEREVRREKKRYADAKRRRNELNNV